MKGPWSKNMGTNLKLIELMFGEIFGQNRAKS